MTQKLIALAIGMTGTFYAVAGDGQRAEITRIWSETCVNLKVIDGPVAGMEPTSVFVPPLGTPADRHPAGYYFLPDTFVAEALRQEEVDSLQESDLAVIPGELIVGELVQESEKQTPAIEPAIVQAGADKAPRVTPADIEANIASEHYGTAADFGDKAIVKVGAEDRPASLGLLTICVLVLRNGFTVTGESACASPENFNAEIGRRIARENAVAKVWPLMGYELRSQLAKARF